MHQRRHARGYLAHRRLTGVVTAVALAAVMAVSTRTVSWSPLCVLYEPWSFLWVWNQCWEAPPNPPEG